MYNTYPVTFPTVTFSLEPVDELVAMAKSVTGKESSYRFDIGICDLPDRKIESVISCYDSEDNMWVIDLSEEEQGEVWDALNSQCKEHLSKDCQQLLEEARGQMRD